MRSCIKQDSLSFEKPRRYTCILTIGFGIGRSRNRTLADGKLSMQALNAKVQDRVLALVETILEQNSIAVKVHPESRLADVGLTSMDMVNLMLGVEAEFDLTIPQSQITPENFCSIKALERMIMNQLQPEKAA
jgi:acyl carrier protein